VQKDIVGHVVSRIYGYSSSRSEQLSCMNIPILLINIPIVDWFEETNFYARIHKC
jgi:hypothetical protein